MTIDEAKKCVNRILKTLEKLAVVCSDSCRIHSIEISRDGQEIGLDIFSACNAWDAEIEGKSGTDSMNMTIDGIHIFVVYEGDHPW